MSHAALDKDLITKVNEQHEDKKATLASGSGVSNITKTPINQKDNAISGKHNTDCYKNCFDYTS